MWFKKQEAMCSGLCNLLAKGVTLGCKVSEKVTSPPIFVTCEAYGELTWVGGGSLPKATGIV